jgi:hypothetical protein
VQLVITDISGKRLNTYSINNAGGGQQIISTKELTSGTYQYSLFANGKFIASKQMMIIK